MPGAVGPRDGGTAEAAVGDLAVKEAVVEDAVRPDQVLGIARQCDSLLATIRESTTAQGSVCVGRPNQFQFS